MLPEQLVDGSFSLQQVRPRGGLTAPTEYLLAIATFTECSRMRTSPLEAKGHFFLPFWLIACGMNDAS
ncbi:hypothetical protein Pyn_02828 [Prunus yedoensis var. nudiflora]|uniref:Uncharacterized protein n=1 Tax=Prunus yedoensis var. nudiflora TaxID=2094558 RepID=A0A315ART6_PRUYE|nr:hypothetical protein Pyn_02828 [Prunus yedoensis var. nudiflora]